MLASNYYRNRQLGDSMKKIKYLMNKRIIWLILTNCHVNTTVISLFNSFKCNKNLPNSEI